MRFEPKWSDRLSLASLAELEQRLKRVEPDGFGALSKDGTTVEPKTCGEWSSLHRHGFEPTTTIEEQPDGFARFRCSTLALLQHVRPARRSYVRGLLLDQGVLAVLPADVASAWSREEVEAVAEASKLGKSLALFNPAARASTDPNTRNFEITEVPGESSSAIVAVEAWGDFNGDGDDDVVISIINLSGGSAQQFRLLVLTRAAPGNVLRVINSG